MERPLLPVAYMLAYARNQTYYVDAAVTLGEAYLFSRQLIHDRLARGETIREVSTLVWFEEHPTLEAAKARAAELRRWPLRWQRRLIDQMNPEWVCLMDVIEKLPADFMHPVPETPRRPDNRPSKE